MDQTDREEGPQPPEPSSARKPWRKPTVIVSDVGDGTAKLNHVKAEYTRSGISYSLS
jgi:hypothetical protein